MGNDPAGEKDFIDLGAMSINLAKMRIPMAYPVLPPEFIPFLAQIAIIWGMFENGFEEILATMFRVNGQEAKAWQFFSFEQKQKLFKKEMRRIFWPYNPMIYLHLKAILDDALRLQIRRNLLLHGKIIIEVAGTDTVSDDRLRVSLIATGRRKKQILIEKFNIDSIESLFCDLAHITGRIKEFAQPDATRSFLHFSWQDRCFLLNLLSKNLPAHARQQTPVPQPPPFQELF